MSLRLENQLQSVNKKRIINYAKIYVNDIKFEAPYFCASKRDYDKSDDARINLHTKIFQHLVEVTNFNARPITDFDRQTSIIKKFNTYVDHFKPQFSDVTFYVDGNTIDNDTRNAILSTQERMNIPFLNDVQLNRNQTLDEFEEQLESFIAYRSNRIKSPTLSLKMPAELFNKKLSLIIKKKLFNRINLEWGGEISSDDNWNTIAEASQKNAIWFNCVAVIQRREHNTPFNSNVMKSILRGVHTCALNFVS